jgi:pilus assembly protein TadC
MGFEDNDVRFKTSRQDFLSLVDGFIDRVFQIRKTFLRVSLSAVILAPLAIALSTFLLFHPSFFAVLEIENEFGLVLSLLLGAVIIISSIWLITGIRQYFFINSWKKRYNKYLKEKQEMDRNIASRYGSYQHD